jgi:hypothetical protein
MRWPKSDLGMKEMLRCLVCGRNAWPTSYAKGQKHGHDLDTLVLVKSMGRGRGIQWRKSSRARDRGYIMMWRNLLMAHLDRLEAMLESMGETFVDEVVDQVEPEIQFPPVTKLPTRTFLPEIAFLPWKTSSIWKTNVPTKVAWR